MRGYQIRRAGGEAICLSRAPFRWTHGDCETRRSHARIADLTPRCVRVSRRSFSSLFTLVEIGHIVMGSVWLTVVALTVRQNGNMHVVSIVCLW